MKVRLMVGVVVLFGALALSAVAMGAKSSLSVQFINQGTTAGVAFFGSVGSSLDSCKKNRDVTVTEGTTVIGSDATTRKGKWQVNVPPAVNPPGTIAHTVVVDVAKRGRCAARQTTATVAY